MIDREEVRKVIEECDDEYTKILMELQFETLETLRKLNKNMPVGTVKKQRRLASPRFIRL